jgi:hypothetical protein
LPLVDVHAAREEPFSHLLNVEGHVAINVKGLKHASNLGQLLWLGHAWKETGKKKDKRMIPAAAMSKKKSVA